MARTRVRGLGLGAILLIAPLGGCGDDDETATSTDAYCESSFAIETAGEPDIDFETATPEQMAEAGKTFARETYVPLVDKLQENVPDEIADEVEIGAGAVDELAETGDFEAAFGKPEVVEAMDKLHAFDLDNCGWGTVDVKAVDYTYQGVPAEIEPGKVSFEFTNAGTELHEMVLFKRNEGVTEPIAELLDLPEEEVETKVTFVGAAFGAPGDEEYALADLEAGGYAMLCFISVGTTSEEAEGDGPPHFVEGMVTEFTVG